MEHPSKAMSKRLSLLIDLLVITIGLTGMSFGQVPPSPMAPMPPTIGRQHPYITVVSVQCTSVVTTVYTVKKLRTIELIDAGLPTQHLETNYVTMGTNSAMFTYTNLCAPNP